MKNEDFTGIWKLVSSEFRSPDGQVIYPMGRDATGMLIYGASGYMSAQVMRPDRCTFNSSDGLQCTTEEMKSIIDGYIAYFGTYEVDQEEGSVTHTIQGCLHPDWIGLKQKRFFEFSDDELMLRAPRVLLGGQQMAGLLHWKRVE